MLLVQNNRFNRAIRVITAHGCDSATSGTVGGEEALQLRVVMRAVTRHARLALPRVMMDAARVWDIDAVVQTMHYSCSCCTSHEPPGMLVSHPINTLEIRFPAT
jgi:hypothetical protein